MLTSSDVQRNERTEARRRKRCALHYNWLNITLILKKLCTYAYALVEREGGEGRDPEEIWHREPRRAQGEDRELSNRAARPFPGARYPPEDGQVQA